MPHIRGWTVQGESLTRVMESSGSLEPRGRARCEAMTVANPPVKEDGSINARQSASVRGGDNLLNDVRFQFQSTDAWCIMQKM